MRTILAIFLIPLLAAAALAGAEEAAGPSVEGQLTVRNEQVDVDTDSSKFNEYRDLQDGFLIESLWIDMLFANRARYLEVAASRVGRDDQSIWLRTGERGSWSLDLDWRETPHHLSNKAMTPFNYQGNGLFVVPVNVPIIFKKLATGAADAPGVVASDLLVAAYLDALLHPTALGTQRDRGTATLSFEGMEVLDVRLRLVDEQRSGSKVTYGPIGDRPPRSLNIQFTEPIDYRTRDAKLEVEHVGESYQFGFSYLVSDFENQLDTLTWENIFATPAAGSDYDVWDRAVSAFGRRPLPPDNELHQATVTFGAGGPLNGRLSGSASYGVMTQDKSLLPYSYADGILPERALPRRTADAEMVTEHASLNYTANPLRSLNLRAFARYYALDNNTPEDRWWYVTSDTSNLNGTRSYKNRRVSLAYAFDTLNLGAELQWRLKPWRSTLVFGYEREEIGRDYREADTGEDVLKLQWRARPSDTLSLRVRYLHGDRDGDSYDSFVTRQSYWYTPAQVGTDNDNPRLTFSNHPDMRRYDVIDRKRDLIEATASWNPKTTFTMNLSWSLRNDDYDDGVVATQPLLGTGLAQQAAFTPGDQLGLLEADRQRLFLDTAFAPSDRLTISAYAGLEESDSLQRSLEYNENNKQNPSAIATAELGPWTRASSQWTADFDEANLSLGAALDWIIRPERLVFKADASWTKGEVDIVYSGFGVTNWDGRPYPDNHQFAFRTPPTIRNELTQIGASLDIRLMTDLSLIVGYGFERYEIVDWQQEANTPWYESVGSEYLLRDTSRSHQWGNRLVNMGSYLAPDYDAHLGWVSLTYRF